MKKATGIFAAIVFLGVMSAAIQAQQSEQAKQPVCTPTTCAYLNPALTPEQRAKDLVLRMTLEEKVSQMQDVAPAHSAAGRSRVQLVE